MPIDGERVDCLFVLSYFYKILGQISSNAFPYKRADTIIYFFSLPCGTSTRLVSEASPVDMRSIPSCIVYWGYNIILAWYLHCVGGGCIQQLCVLKRVHNTHIYMLARRMGWVRGMIVFGAFYQLNLRSE